MGDICFNVLNQNQAQAFAVFRNITQPGTDRRVGAVERAGFSVNTQFPLAAETIRPAENTHHQLGAPGPHRAAESQNFTFAQVE